MPKKRQANKPEITRPPSAIGGPLPKMIMEAATSGNGHDRFTYELWLDDGNSPDAREQRSGGQTALMAAAQNGKFQMMELLLARSASVDLATSTGHTALMHAAQDGHREQVQQLLLARARTDLCTTDAIWTALMLAACHGEQKTVELLLRAGADASIRSADMGMTAQEMAQRSGHLRTAGLIERHATEKLAPWPWMNGEVEEVPEEVRLAAEQGKLVPVARWLSKGGDVNARTRNVREEESDSGSDSDDTDGEGVGTIDGYTLLMHGAQYRQEAVVRALLKRKADANAEGDDGETVLMLALDDGSGEAPHMGVVRLLLENGAHAAWHVADECGAPIHRAALAGSTEAIELLLEHRADPNARGYDGQTPLMMVVSDDEANSLAVDALVRGGADVSLEHKDGYTALDTAAHEGETACVEALIKAGASVTALAISTARKEGYPETLRVLQRARRQQREAWPAAPSDLAGREAAAREAEAARRAGERKAAAADLAARVEQLSVTEAGRHAEARARLQRRKVALDAERAAREQEQAEAPLSLPGPSHLEPKQREEGRQMSMQQQLEQRRWREEKPLRASDFDAKQEQAHADAVIKREGERRQAERAVVAEADKRRQLATQQLVGSASLGECVLGQSAGRRRGGKKHRRPPPTGPLVPPATIATGVPVGDGDSELPVAAAVFEMDFDMD